MSSNDLADDGNVVAPERDLYSVPEAAERLGGISDRQVYRLIKRGELAVVKLGGRTLVTPEAIAELKARLVAEAAA